MKVFPLGILVSRFIRSFNRIWNSFNTQIHLVSNQIEICIHITYPKMYVDKFFSSHFYGVWVVKKKKKQENIRAMWLVCGQENYILKVLAKKCYGKSKCLDEVNAVQISIHNNNTQCCSARVQLIKPPKKWQTRP